ncbi:MAG: VCBS repeat-containing protein, partial [Planctomycetes bacterium]|nr:VCBS repeat-containing protein [Planctomycetota bacterium]
DLYIAQYADVYELLDRPGLTKIDAEGRVDGRHCDWKKLKVYCGPLGLRPSNDLLLKNLLVESGELRFEDASEAAGILFPYTPNSATEQSAGPFYAFQPVAWDIDGDGFQDIFVANDSVANVCWMNRGDGTFEDRALAMSLAMSMSDWNPQASMGVGVGDLNRDGLLDIVMTEFSHDQFNLLLAQRIPATGMVVFDEKAPQTGLREMTFKKLGWGALLLDPDCDGDLEIFFACGHVYPEVDNFPGQETTYRQYNLLVHMLDAERLRFEDVSARAGPGLAVNKCSRAAAVVDFDNDGDPDILTSELNDSPSLLRCDVDRSVAPAHWISLRLRGNPAAQVPLDPAGQGDRPRRRSDPNASPPSGIELPVERGSAAYFRAGSGFGGGVRGSPLAQRGPDAVGGGSGGPAPRDRLSPQVARAPRRRGGCVRREGASVDPPPAFDACGLGPDRLRRRACLGGAFLPAPGRGGSGPGAGHPARPGDPRGEPSLQRGMHRRPSLSAAVALHSFGRRGGAADSALRLPPPDPRRGRFADAL